jgi:hypothetical protein
MNDKRQFVMNSIDGVDMYVGDDFYWARKEKKGKWILERHGHGRKSPVFTFEDTFERSEVYRDNVYNKCFSSQNEAISFIDRMNT